MIKAKKILMGVAMTSMLLATVAVAGGCNKDKESASGDFASGDARNYGSVKLGDYYGIEVELDKIEVTAADIKSEVDSYLSGYEVEDKANKKVDNEEMVNIDYKGTIDGKEFDGGSAEGTSLEIGSNSFIEGFEKGLIGKNVGDKVTLNLKFPTNYGEETVKMYKDNGAEDQAKQYEENVAKLRGKDVQFVVTINYIYAKTPTKLTDEVLANDTNNEYKTVKEYEDSVKKDLLAQKQEKNDSVLVQTVISKVIDNAEFSDLSEDKIQEYYDQQHSQLEQNAKSYGMTLEQLGAMYQYKDLKTFEADILVISQDMLKQEIILDAIADKEEISLTDEEYEKQINDWIAEYASQGVTRDIIIKSYGSEDGARIAVRRQKVLTTLQDKAKITYKEATTEKPSATTEATKEAEK